MDETGSTMGVVASLGASKAITSMPCIGRVCSIQLGNREWVTVIECINALGFTIPPFIIVKGKVHLASWYVQNLDLPQDWVVALSDNSWTNDELTIHWIQHFNHSTRSRTVGNYRLLILDGHGSHAMPEFTDYCKENKIVIRCMPSHSSHELQPLDVACFAPLKQRYGELVQQLARQGVFHVDKGDFLAMYKQLHSSVLCQQTIASGFRATGLIPFNPERVLSRLTVTKTPSPPGSSHGIQSSPWQSGTPQNITQLAKQLQLIKNHSQGLTDEIARLARGAELATGTAVLLAAENAELRASNKRLQEKKNVKHALSYKNEVPYGFSRLNS